MKTDIKHCLYFQKNRSSRLGLLTRPCHEAAISRKWQPPTHPRTLLGLLTCALLLIAFGARGQSNDGFENATLLSGTSVAAIGTNATATLQFGEPNLHGQASVWWRWTAPEAGLVTIDTTDSTFDTLLAAYAGSTLDQLVPVAANHDTPTAKTSRIVFQTAQGQTYQIAVGVNGYPAYGTFISHFHLNFLPNAGPASVVGRPGFDARPPMSGLDGIGISFIATGNPIGHTRWWSWTAPSNGVVTIDNRGSEAYTSLAVYVGNSVDQLLPVRMVDHNAEAASVSQLSFQVAAGTQYQIASTVPSGISTSGNIILNLNMSPNSDAPTVVGTDDFNAPHELSGLLAHGVANSVGAGRQPGEANISEQNQNTVWWSWVAPSDGTAIVDTQNSDFDTTLFVFAGQFVDNLLLITNNDNYNGFRTSRVIFEAQAHRRYHIAVAGNAGYIPRVGNIDLHLYQPGGPDDQLHIYNAVEVELFARADRRYQLQKSPDLTQWADVGGQFYGSNTFKNWFFPTRPGEKELYRAKTVVP